MAEPEDTARPAATPQTAAPQADTATDAAPDTATDTGQASSDLFPRLDSEHDLPATTARPEARGAGINAMLNVGLDVQVVLGHARMPISQLLELSRGSIVELNRKIGAPVDLIVSDRLVARGDLVKVGEDRLGVSLTQIVKDYVAD